MPLVPSSLFVDDSGAQCAFDPRRVRVRAAEGLEAAQRWIEDELASVPASDSVGEELVVELALGAPPTRVPAATGIHPDDVPSDERHTLEIGEGRVRITGPSLRAIARGAATLLQLLSAPDRVLPVCRIEDGPRYAWRGLSLDVVRHPFTVDEIERVVDLLARYKLNVLHLHLTDSQGWRLESDRYPALRSVAGGSVITFADVADLAARAAGRGVTIVPEVDVPGHSVAAIRAYPELAPDVRAARFGYLDPGVPAAREFIEATAAEFAEHAPSAYVHVGGDEPFGMPEPAYVDAVRAAVGAVRATGKKVAVWQEAVRTGAISDAELVQFWIGAETHIDVDAKKAELPPEAHPFVDQLAELFALAAGDLPAAAHAGAPVLVSSNDVLYLDRPYLEPASTPDGEARRGRVGFRDYPAKTLREMYEWSPEALVAGHDVEIAGVEAAVWSETIDGFDDLAFLLLPRLTYAAERAWALEPAAWEDVDGRLASHRPTWARTGWGAAYEPR